MRVIQVLPTMAYGDAVGNDTMALYYTLKEMGFDTKIYAENIDKRLKGIEKVGKIGKLKDDDVVIYHLSTGTKLNYQIADWGGKLIVIFHNITPPEFYNKYNKNLERICADGWNGVRYLADKVEYCLADSEYNKQNLIELGYKCKIDVLPILIRFSDYEKKPSAKIMKKYQDDGYTNILFTGRIAPNKKQEDVIAAFSCYQKYYNEKSRLFIVGSYNGMENYNKQLQNYVEELGVKNVVFTGHIPFDEILAYYHFSDLFLCMSQHEGFCVPLVEAMYFDVPIIAYDEAAIGDTLGGSGILLDDNSPVLVAGMMNRLLTDTELKDKVLQNQRIRLKDFSHDLINEKFKEYLKSFIGE